MLTQMEHMLSRQRTRY